MSDQSLSRYTVTTPRHTIDMEVDAVTTQVIKHALDAAAEQMAVALRRAAFSPMIYDSHDYAGALYDREVRLIAQMKCLPIFVGTLNFVVEAAIERLGAETFREGDAIVSSYGYDTGSHPQDVTVIVPVFLDGDFVGYAVNKAHHTDLGAAHLFMTDSTDMWQEGILYPSVRLYRAGERNEDLYRTMMLNTRLPAAFEGDLHAQIGACKAAGDALIRTYRRYGYEKVTAATEALFDVSERAMRDSISSIPDGRYTVSAEIDNDGVGTDPLPYDVTVEISGSDIVVDLSIAAPETAGPINCPLATTVSCTRCAILALAGIIDGANEGYFRPLTIVTKPHTVFHAYPPSAMFLYAWPMITGIDHIHRALAGVVPQRLTAQTGSDNGALLTWGTHPDGTFWGGAANHAGGHGAAYAYGDGGGPIMHISCSGTRNSSTEVLESRMPYIVTRVELACDSGGPGKLRGGPCLETHYLVLEDLYVTLPWERVRTPPFGLDGGHAGRKIELTIEFPDGKIESYLKASAVPVPKGSIIRLHTGGGGGIGDPSERDPEAIHEDIENGYVSEKAARRDYPHAFSTAPKTSERVLAPAAP